MHCPAQERTLRRGRDGERSHAFCPEISARRYALGTNMEAVERDQTSRTRTFLIAMTRLRGMRALTQKVTSTRSIREHSAPCSYPIWCCNEEHMVRASLTWNVPCQHKEAQANADHYIVRFELLCQGTFGSPISRGHEVVRNLQMMTSVDHGGMSSSGALPFPLCADVDCSSSAVWSVCRRADRPDRTLLP